MAQFKWLHGIELFADFIVTILVLVIMDESVDVFVGINVIIAYLHGVESLNLKRF